MTTAKDLEELEIWTNYHFRPCSDTWPRMIGLIRELREIKGIPDPKIRVPTLDEFEAEQKIQGEHSPFP